MILAASGPRPCFDGWQSHSDWLDFNLIKFSYFATLLVFASLSFLYFFTLLQQIQMLQVCFLDRGVVKIIQIIEADDFIAALEQVFTDVATDKAGTPCDQNASRHVSGPLGTGQHPSLNWTDYRGC